jgi:hypothetical protein
MLGISWGKLGLGRKWRQLAYQKCNPVDSHVSTVFNERECECMSASVVVSMQWKVQEAVTIFRVFGNADPEISNRQGGALSFTNTYYVQSQNERTIDNVDS